ncbi:hypothetical protein B6N60_01680 [Richelia sinica FACHB-800]|uniref:Uncharacterized protein n=1 Tax=Richelia sinica FACHB-800 TaxID=1357546 RepID=A0A975Y4B8_9NOST|nr:hypothetical protein B6N60_01680 [Richelia sinica FACHB-800]
MAADYPVIYFIAIYDIWLRVDFPIKFTWKFWGCCNEHHHNIPTKLGN